MSKKDKVKLAPFVAVTKGLMDTPAWRAMSIGARVAVHRISSADGASSRRNNG